MTTERRDFTEEAVQAVTQLGLRRHVMGVLDKAARRPWPSTVAVRFSLSFKTPTDKPDRQITSEVDPQHPEANALGIPEMSEFSS